jgi:hypothetical protein
MRTVSDWLRPILCVIRIIIIIIIVEMKSSINRTGYYNNCYIVSPRGIGETVVFGSLVIGTLQ